MTLTPSERSLRARMAAHSLHATHDSRELTERARAAGPGSMAYWDRKVDPDGQLDAHERSRRAEHARKSYYASLALKSAGRSPQEEREIASAITGRSGRSTTHPSGRITE